MSERLIVLMEQKEPQIHCQEIMGFFYPTPELSVTVANEWLLAVARKALGPDLPKLLATDEHGKPIGNGFLYLQQLRCNQVSTVRSYQE